jgi:hypothetical protein
MTRLYAEFDNATAVVRAIAEARDWGIVRLETYSPYPIAAIERALDAPPSRVASAVLVAGFTGAAAAYSLEWLLNAYLYPLNVGGRPTHFPLAFVPITFEMGVLFASLTAFFGVIIGGRLLRLWHPVFDIDGIESASATNIWLEVGVAGEPPDLDDLQSRLILAGALVVRRHEVAP